MVLTSCILHGALAFPNWDNGEPNNGENTDDEDCVVLAVKMLTGLTDVYCKREYTDRSHPAAVVCERTQLPTQPSSTVPTPSDASGRNATDFGGPVH